jgi:hypothetical protein
VVATCAAFLTLKMLGKNKWQLKVSENLCISLNELHKILACEQSIAAQSPIFNLLKPSGDSMFHKF